MRSWRRGTDRHSVRMSKVTWLSLVGKVTADVKETEGIGCGRRSRLTCPSGEGRSACVRMCLREKSPEHRLQPKLCASGWFLSLVPYSLPLAATDGFRGGCRGHSRTCHLPRRQSHVGVDGISSGNLRFLLAANCLRFCLSLCIDLDVVALVHPPVFTDPGYGMLFL